MNAHAEIAEDMVFEKKSHRVRVAGRILMFMILVLALCGLFGGGTLSQKTVHEKDLSLSYPQISRNSLSQIWTTEIGGTASSIRFSYELLKDILINDIIPRPIHTSYRDDHIEFFFLRKEKTKNLKSIFYLKPQKSGWIRGEVRTPEHSVKINQFVFP